jgi:hypothetical protein
MLPSRDKSQQTIPRNRHITGTARNCAAGRTEICLENVWSVGSHGDGGICMGIEDPVYAEDGGYSVPVPGSCSS